VSVADDRASTAAPAPNGAPRSTAGRAGAPGTGPEPDPAGRTAAPVSAAAADPGRRAAGDGAWAAGWPAPVAVAGALVAAWAVPLALHAVRVDWLTLLAVVVGTASLLRGGPYLLDRLVLSMALLAGVGCVAVLVLPPWPWRLHPVLLGGLGLTALALLSAGLGRRPALPRPRSADALVLVPAGLIGSLFAAPFIGRSVADRAAVLYEVEDPARHFAIYDTIRRVGGYPFQHAKEAAVSVIRPDLTYPAGAHAVAAVLDNFVTSSVTVGDPVHALSRFVWYVVAGYTFLGLAVLWSARRLAGPAATAWSFAPIAGACVGYLVFSEMITTLMFGYVPQAVGTGYLVVLLGLLARPLRGTREQVLAVAALVVAIGFTYYLLLPIAAVAAVPYAVVARRRLRRRWLFTAVVALVAVPLAVLPRQVNSGDHPLDLLLQRFAIVRADRSTILALGLLVLAGGWLGRGWWRTHAMRTAAVAVLGAGAFAAVVAAAQLYYVGQTRYFLDKLLYVLIPVLLVALGGAAPAVARLLPPRRTGRLATAAVALLLAAIPVAGLGGFEPQAGPARVNRAFGRLYLVGAYGKYPAGRLTIRAYRALGPGPARPMLFYTHTGYEPLATVWASALQRDQGVAWDTYLWGVREWRPGDAGQLQAYLLDRPALGLQLVTSDPALLDAMRRFAAEHPDIALTIVDDR
jgi:hypothetical protein